MVNTAVFVNTQSNGKSVEISITDHGSSFYYAICAVMGFTGISIMLLSLLKPKTDRAFFYITAAINLTACIAYYSMGSNLGWTPVDVEFPRLAEHQSRVRGVNREIFYVRYIDWFITTPLLLLDLLLTAGVPWPRILWTCFFDIAMVVMGLIGALVKTRFKWGYFAFAVVSMWIVFYQLLVTGRRHSKHIGNDVYRVYNACGLLTIFIWTLYPVAWGVCEGGNVIAPDSEAVFYGILDLIAKPLFSIILIVGHWKIDPARLNLKLRDYDEEPLAIHHKKRDKPETITAATTGATATPANATV